jgi:hypothetical protein
VGESESFTRDYGIIKVYKTKEVVKKHLSEAFRDVGFSGELQVGSASTGTETKTIIVPEKILEIEQHLKKCWYEKERKRRAIKVPGVPELDHLQGMDRARAILAFETHGGPHKMNADDTSHVDLVERLGKLPKDTLREILVEYLAPRPEIVMSLASLYATQISGVKSSAPKVRIVTLLDLGTRHLIIYPVYRHRLPRTDSAVSPSSARTSPILVPPSPRLLSASSRILHALPRSVLHRLPHVGNIQLWLILRCTPRSWLSC